jgi:hypothetical protein
LRGKKARDFYVLFFMVPVNEFDRIIVYDMNKVFLFPVIDTVQINRGSFFQGFFLQVRTTPAAAIP